MLCQLNYNLSLKTSKLWKMLNSDGPEIIERFKGHFSSGAAAGLVSRTFTAPLDMVKTRIQVDASVKKKVLKEISTIYNRYGLLGFWRGNTINVLKVSFGSGFKFSAYNEMKEFIVINGSEVTPIIRFFSGSFASVFSYTLAYPLDVIKTGLMTSEHKISTINLIKRMYRERGWRSYYKGYTPGVVSGIPYGGLDLSVYEGTKTYLWPSQKSADAPMPSWVPFAAGATSTCVATTATYPLFMAKTLAQANRTEEAYFKVLKDIYRKRGVRGLYSGHLVSTTKTLPAKMLSYFTYESMAKFLGVEMK